MVVPANTTATAYVPAKKIENVTESGKKTPDAPGVTFLRMDKEKAVFSLGSGSYEFVSKHYENKPDAGDGK